MISTVQKFGHIPTADIEADLKWTTATIIDLSLQISHFNNYSAFEEVQEMVHTCKRLQKLQHKLRGILSHRKTTKDG